MTLIADTDPFTKAVAAITAVLALLAYLERLRAAWRATEGKELAERISTTLIVGYEAAKTAIPADLRKQLGDAMDAKIQEATSAAEVEHVVAPLVHALTKERAAVDADGNAIPAVDPSGLVRRATDTAIKALAEAASAD